MDTDIKSLNLHAALRGKLSVETKTPIESFDDLSLVYTPGVAEVCREIARNPAAVNGLTIKSDTVAVVTNGTAVLGLGNIGTAAALPVMEGKCALFKRFGGLNAFPVCVDTRDVNEFVEIVKKIAVPFAGINLEDIAAPECFEIERRLIEELDIPVFHDDQHGTAIVVLAALINAMKVTGKEMETARIAVLGAGAAGTAIAKLLHFYGAGDVTVCDRRGIIYAGRKDIMPGSYKHELALLSGCKVEGSVADALKGADVFIGVSGPGLVTKEMIAGMNKDAIVFAMANPVPEIMPGEAEAAGAMVTGTGRSDMKNQINNVLAFPGVFMGVVEALRERSDDGPKVGKVFIDERVKTAAAEALAALVDNPSPDRIVPGVFDPGVAAAVALAVKSTIR